MSKITFNNETLKLMSLFQYITKANLKDCFLDDNDVLTYVVEQNEIGKAIGKKAVNLKKLEFKLKRKIKIIEYNPDVCQFARNVVFPLSPNEVELQGKILTFKDKDNKTKGLMIGRNAKNLRNSEKIIQKYFDIEEVKVI